MGPIKYLRVRSREKRIKREDEERTREEGAEQLRIRNEKKEEERKKREQEHRSLLKIIKEESSKFLLNHCSKVYIEKAGKKLDDYDLENIEALYETSGEYHLDNPILEAKAIMSKKAKQLGAEVITNITYAVSHTRDYNSSSVYMSGTALIPKKSRKTKKSK